MIELKEAGSRIRANVKKIKRTEMVPLIQAMGRRAAADYMAPMSNPPFDRSPLDGYACRSEDMADGQPLKKIDKIFAGMRCDKVVGDHECVRLMTGAPIPKGADCVIKQEETSELNGIMHYQKAMKHLQNIVFAGEDIQKGDEILSEGTNITKMHLCVLASVGISEVEVYQKVTASIITTGDEVAQPHAELKEAQIYDSTSTYIRASLEQQGVEVMEHSCSLDSEGKLKQNILDHVKKYDFIITTGGVSVGEKDLLEKVLNELGADILFHGVEMKPGSPVMAAILDGKVVLSLSGNPFAALATLELIGRVCLSAMSDCFPEPEFVEALNKTDYLKVRNHDAYIRAYYDGHSVMIPDANHSSGSIRSMIGCNALVYVPKNTMLKADQRVKVMSIDA